ncbi:bifunctional diaminohydroxyphosphoribosylaminopyrimidine deaminase/5-amino-6-(5-phosphoribosylamino)uracil reductase RibD [Haloferula sp.]|uniref:bifunctional diaminohydroxyphosphoribosylaminopyrimidine deaminase/5-amino-6-(5-phosphoribosylamino)uracil reductase RibD n=1 Tax=Haloferula sp. TaxID=2497595 RepID=UPI00329AECF4
MSDHELWMHRAIEEAGKGVGRTAPNPPVGAVIVRDGVELGAGWHRAAGQPHAEREAIAAVRDTHGDDAMRGSTIFVTLEPCSTRGRTPACTDGVIEAGISKVVYAATDPNPAHAGRADEVLRGHGIEVVSGVLAEEAERLIRPFAKVQRSGLPWVMLKTAMSMDGRLTRPPGEGMWLTGTEARAEVQQLRASADAMLTSGETVRRDRPRLDLREPVLLEGRSQPWRVVLTNDPESLPKDAPLFCDEHSDRTLVMSRLDPEAALRQLVEEHGVNSVMVECGGRLAGALLDAGLIDEVAVFMAPMLNGGPVTAMGGDGFPEGLKLDEISFSQFGPDVMMRGVLKSFG